MPESTFEQMERQGAVNALLAQLHRDLADALQAQATAQAALANNALMAQASARAKLANIRALPDECRHVICCLVENIDLRTERDEARAALAEAVGAQVIAQGAFLQFGAHLKGCCWLVCTAAVLDAAGDGGQCTAAINGEAPCECDCGYTDAFKALHDWPLATPTAERGREHLERDKARDALLEAARQDWVMVHAHAELIQGQPAAIAYIDDIAAIAYRNLAAARALQEGA